MRSYYWILTARPNRFSHSLVDKLVGDNVPEILNLKFSRDDVKDS
jgi:hypothetical protein